MAKAKPEKKKLPEPTTREVHRVIKQLQLVMAKEQGPKLTPVAIKGLIERLDAEKNKIDGLNLDFKQVIQDRFDALIGILNTIKDEPSPVIATTWQSSFSEWTNLMKAFAKQLNLDGKNDFGACIYEGGCANMTKDECDGLGDFHPGVSCDGSGGP